MSKKQIGGAAANKKITSKHTEKIVEMRNFLSGHKGQLFQCFLALLIFSWDRLVVAYKPYCILFLWLWYFAGTGAVCRPSVYAGLAVAV